MSHSFPILFEPRKLTRVSVAIEPFDAFTGQTVQQRLDIRLTGRADAAEQERLPVRLIHNGRGQLILPNLPGGTRVFVHIRAARFGYLDPDVVEVETLSPADTPGADDRLARVNRLIRVPLYPAPAYPFLLWPEITLIRGQVLRTRQARGEPVARARVWVDPPPSAPSSALPFATLTDHTGSFALPIRLPPLRGADSPAPVPVTLHVVDDDRSGNPPVPLERQIDLRVEDGRTHTLQPPIDLSNPTPVRVASPQFGRVWLRGLIVRARPPAAARPVTRALVTVAAGTATTDSPSTTRSDDFGRFELSIRLPAGAGAAPSSPAQLTLRIRDDDRSGTPPRPVERILPPVDVLEGSSYAAQSPIDLDGTGPVPFPKD